MSCSGEMPTPDGLYASDVDSMTLVASGGKFTPGSLYDSGWNSVTLVTGKYTDGGFSYISGVGCVCMLNDWVQQCGNVLPMRSFHPSRYVRFKFCQYGAYDYFLYVGEKGWSAGRCREHQGYGLTCFLIEVFSFFFPGALPGGVS